MRPDLLISKIGTPAPPKKVWVDNNNQTIEAIQNAMLEAHEYCKPYYDKIAGKFAAGSVENVCRVLYNFCKKNFKYVEESKANQYISSPQTLLARGTSDCKGYALFCGGVLDALRRAGANINWRFRYSNYKPWSKDLSHVFIVVKNNGSEIWLDPVLNSFNYHKPVWIAEDIFCMSARPAKVSGCGCGEDPAAVGATNILSTAGTLVSAAAPALNLIPVAGPFIAAGAQIAGLAAQLFGKSYATSERVRWLTYLYQQNVLGQNINYQGVNEALTDESHTWFNAVFGVPIYDDLRYHTLTGTSTTNGQKLSPFPDETTRAKAYMQYWDSQQSGVTMEDALQAAKIGTTFPAPAGAGGRLGGWAQLPPSQYYAAKIAAAQQQTQGGHEILNSAGGGNTLLIVAAAGLGVYLLTKNKKRRA